MRFSGDRNDSNSKSDSNNNNISLVPISMHYIRVLTSFDSDFLHKNILCDFYYSICNNFHAF
jgi:hypothetical protein